MDKMKKLLSDHPWSSLSTITTFDIGSDQDVIVENNLNNDNMDEMGTELIRNIDIIGLLKAKASTPISLLVESLVQQLCSLLETDSIKATKLYNIICEKLYEMKLIDESYSMEEFELMRSQYQRALYQLVRVAKGSDITKSIHYPLPQNNIALDSRYNKEFIELEYLGGGGFGRVYKARHRLDGSEYAVKKICICAGTVKAVMTHLKEVKTFAILNHPNVVQYKAAWLEPFINSNKSSTVNEPLESYSLFSNSETSERKTSKCTVINKKFEYKDNSSDFSIEFVDSNKENNSKSFSEENQICKITSSDDIEESIQIRRKPKTEWLILYIQMALCQSTLKQWLEERHIIERKNPPNTLISVKHRMSTVWNIFKQMVSGLQYIHTKGIVHHDIKPSNIFISTDNETISVQLGDFGLACPLEKPHNGTGIGTHLYAAPEQLDGICDIKSDIFSLGIVLLELIESFATDMERVQNITELRKGRLAAHISAEHPQLAHIMSQLVSRRTTQRPDATKLLEMIEAADSTTSIVNINYLEQQLKDKDAEIERLKALLNQAGIQS